MTIENRIIFKEIEEMINIFIFLLNRITRFYNIVSLIVTLLQKNPSVIHLAIDLEVNSNVIIYVKR